MSDHLLRLARIMHDLTMETGARAEFDARQLIRDLEAAPPPARRTITREEYDEALAMCQRLRDRNAMPRPVVERLLDILRLTVED